MSIIDRVIDLKNKVKELEEQRAKATGQLEAVEREMENTYNTKNIDELLKKLNEMQSESAQFENEFLTLLDAAEKSVNKTV